MAQGKESACTAGFRFYPWIGKMPWRRKWLPTSVFLPGKSHEQKTLVGYRSQTVANDLATKQQILQ